MARVCDQCKKAYMNSVKRKKTRSKYNPINFYRQKVNLQRITVDGSSLRLCQGCRRKLLKTS